MIEILDMFSNLFLMNEYYPFKNYNTSKLNNLKAYYLFVNSNPMEKMSVL